MKIGTYQLVGEFEQPFAAWSCFSQLPELSRERAACSLNHYSPPLPMCML